MSDDNNRYTLKISGPITFILMIGILTIVAASSIVTVIINQVGAQTVNTTVKEQVITDINVHFKTACISVIVFTYCW